MNRRPRLAHTPRLSQRESMLTVLESLGLGDEAACERVRRSPGPQVPQIACRGFSRAMGRVGVASLVVDVRAALHARQRRGLNVALRALRDRVTDVAERGIDVRKLVALLLLLYGLDQHRIFWPRRDPKDHVGRARVVVLRSVLKDRLRERSAS